MTVTANRFSIDEEKDIADGYEYATDVTTTSGEVPSYSGGGASEGVLELEQRLAGFSIRNPESQWQKMIWCIFQRARNEIVCLSDVEVADAVATMLEDSTVTESTSAEFRKQVKGLFESLSIREGDFPVSEAISAREPAEARTALGRRLREIRQRIEASGASLLDWDGIERERKERRGERNSE